MDIKAVFNEVGTYRGTAEICGTSDKTVRRVVNRPDREEPEQRGHNYDAVAELVAEKVRRTRGRITAKRLLPVARAAGYEGSARNFRRLVATAKADWRRDNHRGRRPGVWAPGDVLVIDWGEIGPLFVFCAVLAWSRIRFVLFADNLGAETTLSALAECFEYLGGVPKVVLTDRMGCLKADTVAGIVVPTADYVRFATHYGFRPDFCLGQDPESKGLVENLVGYVKSDLMIPEELSVSELLGANEKRLSWLEEVNGAVHSEICAVPAQRLERERELLGQLPSLRARIGKQVIRKVDRLSCIRFGSARYSVPTNHIGRQVQVLVRDGVLQILDLGEIIARHELVAPGESSVQDDHYGGPRPAPRRAARAKTATEKAFLSLGPVAESFLRKAAAAGISTLAGDLDELVALQAAHGTDALLAGLERALSFGRLRARDVRSIIEAGAGVPHPTKPGEAMIVPLPVVGTRPLSDYAIGDER
jgi:transposase